MMCIELGHWKMGKRGKKRFCYQQLWFYTGITRVQCLLMNNILKKNQVSYKLCPQMFNGIWALEPVGIFGKFQSATYLDYSMNIRQYPQVVKTTYLKNNKASWLLLCITTPLSLKRSKNSILMSPIYDQFKAVLYL